MKDTIILVLIYGVIHAVFNWWTDSTVYGIALKKYLQEWRADGWVHGILCSVSVFILACCGIVGLALALSALGL